MAESFNAKIKLFRANLRGVVDKKYFLFRIVSIPSTPYFIKSSLFRTLQSKTTIKFEECLA